VYVCVAFSDHSHLPSFLFFLSYWSEVYPSVVVSRHVISDEAAFDNPEFSDVTFIVEGQPLHAHKVFLSLCVCVVMLIKF
jgi:hypothetical protein